MTLVACSIPERYVNPLFEVFDGGDFILSSYRDVEDALTEMRIFTADPAEAPEAVRLLKEAGAVVGLELEPETRVIPDEDWKLSYRKHFKTEVISPRLAIVPEWEVAAFKAALPASGPHPAILVLDPGMAFGTGQHATTHACLEFIDELATADPNRSFLDVGCGSGILAIAATLCGFRDTAGFDIDPDAVQNANENAAKNGVKTVFTRGDLCNVSTLPDVSHTGDHRFDVVAANVLGPILVRFAAEIVRTVKRGPSSRLILSGILDEVYPEVKAAYEAQGCRELATRLIGEWRTGLFTAP